LRSDAKEVTRRGDVQEVTGYLIGVRHLFSSLLSVTSFRHLLLTALLLAPLSASAAELFSLNTGDLKAELADARKDGRRALMLFFEQEGCPGCAHMKQSVFARKDVQSFYSKHFASLVIDIHGSVPLRDFADRDVTEKTFAQASKIRATPTFVFYDLKGVEIVRIVGPTETPEEFLLLGEFVASGAYRTRTFAQYKTEKPVRKGS